MSREPIEFRARFVAFQERDLALREALHQERIIRNGANAFVIGGFVFFLLFSIATMTIQRFIIAGLVAVGTRVAVGYFAAVWCARKLEQINKQHPLPRQSEEEKK
jgi:hypothetical protein